jgi:hypothetical protein
MLGPFWTDCSAVFESRLVIPMTAFLVNYCSFSPKSRLHFNSSFSLKKTIEHKNESEALVAIDH